jgi:hypothetical protein
VVTSSITVTSEISEMKEVMRQAQQQQLRASQTKSYDGSAITAAIPPKHLHRKAPRGPAKDPVYHCLRNTKWLCWLM